MNRIPNGLPIGAVERETGIPKDLLRMWERRYGFPEPGRDGQGDRLYPREQVDKLRQVRRLMDLGFRPGKVIGLPPDQLALMLDAHQPAWTPSPACADLIALLRGSDGGAVRDYLQRQLAVLGLRPFVGQFLLEANLLVGDAWMRGEIEVYEEHLYTELVNRVLREALQRFSLPMVPPRVLLTTWPGEQHQLGILMVEVFLRLAGAEVLPFGVEMPGTDIVKAAHKYGVDVVALSFSAAFDDDLADTLRPLVAALPRGTEIWLGGQGCRGLKSQAGAWHVMATLDELEGRVAAWRAGHAD